ncbi:MAG: NAD(P)H-hydrate dehydratase [Thermodesulfovibrionales bacterium]
MKIVTAKEMQAMDRKTIEGYGIPGLVLMERAGLAVAAKVREVARGRKVLVLAGRGNNGGDGLVAARELANSGYRVRALVQGTTRGLSPDCRHQLEVARKMGVRAEFRARLTEEDIHGAVVVDALFGTGLGKDITGELAKSISLLNGSGAPVVSVDMPSGVSSDTGRVLGVAVRASATVTFGLPKRGHLLHPGAGYTGELTVEDIGFPSELLNAASLRCELIDRDAMALLLPERPAYSHKGHYGHVLVVAGSRGKTGAALMAAAACLRTGAGLVTIGAPESLAASFQSAVREEMFLPLPDTGRGTLSAGALDAALEFVSEKADVLAIGPGIGTEGETREVVLGLVERCAAPMVLDADGLNCLEGKAAALARAKAPIVATPHPGEFSRLTGKGVNEIEEDRIEAALAFAKKTGVSVVLKGVPTVVASPEGYSYLNPTGNPGMAKGGTGDVLTGMASALLAQGLEPLGASLLAVYAHGLAGDMAAAQKGLASVTALDLVGAIPGALKSLAGREAC